MSDRIRTLVVKTVNYSWYTPQTRRSVVYHNITNDLVFVLVANIFTMGGPSVLAKCGIRKSLLKARGGTMKNLPFPFITSILSIDFDFDLMPKWHYCWMVISQRWIVGVLNNEMCSGLMYIPPFRCTESWLTTTKGVKRNRCILRNLIALFPCLSTRKQLPCWGRWHSSSITTALFAVIAFRTCLCLAVLSPVWLCLFSQTTPSSEILESGRSPYHHRQQRISTNVSSRHPYHCSNSSRFRPCTI